MPVPTEAEREPTSPLNSTPAAPAEATSSGSNGDSGDTSPVCLNETQTLPDASVDRPT